MNEAMHQQARVMGPDEMQRLLKKCSHGRLGLAFQNEPYVVPVSYGYDQGRIFFHSAKQGKKVDFMRRNNKVCFEVDEYQKGWASVLCYGTAVLREDIEAKTEFFEVLMGHKPSDEQLKNMVFYVGIIQIEDMTGRCSADFSP
jgi:nitroimidazol reductase NimA-like FMN-containing flavoprotein (pyridoxamine 5'-phosphate oxidase superfamily)